MNFILRIIRKILNFIFNYQTTGKRITIRIFGIKCTYNSNSDNDEQNRVTNAQYESGENKNIPHVADVKTTLDTLVSSNKSIARFGDGELNLVFGESLPFQEFDKELQKKLKIILKNEQENIMIGLPDMFGDLSTHKQDHQWFWRRYVVNYRDKICSIINMDSQYYDTNVTRLYMEYLNYLDHEECFNKFKMIWHDKDIIFVEGEGTRLGYNNDLFKGAKSIKRIICPAKNAFSKYGKILDECKKIDKDKLFIIALGPTATVLAYDLALLGYRALDTGHMDIEYEWFKMKAQSKVPIKNKYVNEAKGGRVITKLNDEKYLSEIIVNLA